MRFLLDNNLPPRLAKALDELVGKDCSVVALREKFDADVDDVTWIANLATEGGWCIVSEDIRITRNKPEREAWLEAGLTGFFLAKGWNDLEFWEKSWRLVKWFPRLMSQAASVKAGACFQVPVRGEKLELLRIDR